MKEETRKRRAKRMVNRIALDIDGIIEDTQLKFIAATGGFAEVKKLFATHRTGVKQPRCPKCDRHSVKWCTAYGCPSEKRR